MKFTKIFAGALAALAVSASQASIIQPSTGDSEVVAVLYDFAGTGNSFTLDTGILFSAFDTTQNQSFNLATLSPLWNNFKSSVTGTMQFGVMAADGVGPATGVAGSRSILFTTAAGNGPSGLNNTKVNQAAGAIGGTYLAAISGAANNPSFTSLHSSTANGSSFSLGGAGATGFDVFQNNWNTPLGIQMINAGSNAELFKAALTGASGPNPATVTDFYKATETATNLGGFWTLDASSGVLAYNAAPVPEASEWAMMLAGLGMVGFMVRRRSRQFV